MKLKEMFSAGDTRTASKLGSSNFHLTLNKEMVKTPHVRMDKVLRMIEDRPNIASGLKQITRFILSDIHFTGKDEKSVKFLTEWYKKRPKLYEELFNFTYITLGCGCGYLEPSYMKTTNGSMVLDNLTTVSDPSVMFLNLHCQNENNDYWLVQVPIDVREIHGQTPKFDNIYYIEGSYLRRYYIWSLRYPKSKFMQKTIGWSRDGMYGAGLLSAAVDNADIEREILKNWALMAKYRALGKKIIGFYAENGETIDPTEIQNLKEEFNSLEEEESLIVNRKFVSEDLSFTGQDNMFDQQIEYLRKDSGSSLVPNYMTAFSQDSSMATASEAKVPFSLELKSLQQEFQIFFQDVIVNQLRKTYTWLAEDTQIDLGNPELYSRNEIFTMISQLYNLRAATFNELRRSAGLDAVPNGDRWGQEPPLDNTTITIKPEDKPGAKNIISNDVPDAQKEMFIPKDPAPQYLSIPKIELSESMRRIMDNELQALENGMGNKKKQKNQAFQEAVKQLLI